MKSDPDAILMIELPSIIQINNCGQEFVLKIIVNTNVCVFFMREYVSLMTNHSYAFCYGLHFIDDCSAIV